jgi:alpha-1,3-glucosyltransferase
MFNPEWFALDVSRGFESEESKLFMRSSVLILEYLIYVPSVIVFVNWWLANKSWQKRVRTLKLYNFYIKYYINLLSFY